MSDAVGIQIQSISKRFEHRVKGEVYAVREVSLDVRPGELVTLLGPSGCGKTTTLRMIAGFEMPDAGRVLIGERDVTHVMANERNVGFVFQSYALFPHLTVFENIAYGLRVQRCAETEIATRVGEVLTLVGLTGYDKQMPHQLSGGEQQRVALARAIVFRPRVLLFDEPLSNLDAKLRVAMREEIQRLQRALGITSVYVTHDQEEAMAISDRIAVMNQGEIAQLGSAEDLYHRPNSVFVAGFIGRACLIPARVAARRDGRTELDVLGRSHEVSTTDIRFAPGDRVRLVLRPEAVTLASSGNGGIGGTIEARHFLGEKTEYRVSIGGHSIQIASQAESFRVGDAVTVVLPTDRLHLLPGES